MQAKAVATPATAADPMPGATLQRKCACGRHQPAGADCAQCKGQKTSSATLQKRLRVGKHDDPHEHEADRVAARVMQMPEPHKAINGDRQSPVPAGALIQRRAVAPGDTAGDAPPAVQATLRTPGEPLPQATRSFMEPRFGHDFSQVRLHHDAVAARSAGEIGAQAYTAGNHIVFGNGYYAPQQAAGRELLAHELTHVIQQSHATPGQPVPLRRRNIFQEIAGLFAGESFDAATLQAYMNHLLNQDRIEDFTDSDNKARAIVTAWKRGGSPYNLTPRIKTLLIQEMQSGFTGNADEGAILEILWRSDNATLRTIFGAIPAADLNSDFHGAQWDELQTFYARRFTGGMASVLAGTINPTGSAVPLGVDIVGLRAPDPATKARIMEAINTEARTASGAQPTFQRNISGHADAWEVRIETEINALITSMHNRIVVSRPPRVAANMLATADIDRVAGAAQAETDSVYDNYYGSRPRFVWGTNIFDAFTTRSANIAASVSNADRAANFRVLKLLNGHSRIARINQQHGAIYTRAAEWALVAPLLGFPVGTVLTEELNRRSPPHVTTGIVGNRRAELLDIHRNWSAFAGRGQIFLDRMRAPNANANRDKMYRIFGTVIHEYIHTLEHPEHENYRKTLGAQQGGFVLREGVTEFLAKRVWDQVNFDPALRSTIEGGFQDPLNPNGHSIPLPPRYAEWRNAERMAQIAGLNNVQAAFFLGRTDLIGA